MVCQADSLSPMQSFFWLVVQTSSCLFVGEEDNARRQKNICAGSCQPMKIKRIIDSMFIEADLTGTGLPRNQSLRDLL